MRNIGKYLVIGATGFFSELNYPGNCVRCSNNLMLRPCGYGGYRAYTRAQQRGFAVRALTRPMPDEAPSEDTRSMASFARAMLLAENNTDARLFCTAARQAGTA